MQEKRRKRRIPINMQLEISTLFKQDNVRIGNLDASIYVINISETGIAFRTDSILPINYYFNAKFQLGREESRYYCVVRIIRMERNEKGENIYGCEFVGFPPKFAMTEEVAN